MLVLLAQISLVATGSRTIFSPVRSRVGVATLALRSPMASPKVLVGYAKSNRSKCKNCDKLIDKGALRLATSVKDHRGFNLEKWYHVDCFPAESHSIDAAEKIDGFSSLKGHDKEVVRKLEAAVTSVQIVNQVVKRDVNDFEKSEATNAKKQKISLDGEGNFSHFEFSLSDVKDKYKDATLAPKWKAFQTVIFREKENESHDSEKIAAFDFDGCLANTSVKRVGADAWSLMYPSIPKKLQDLHNNGYKLVIFTNESNIERWKNKRQEAVNSKIGMLENFIKCVKVPIQVFIACGLEKNKDQTVDAYRKPQNGMWRLMKEHLNSGISIDMDQSFYVGDAAGRIKDHSDADIKFAQAVGLKFYVPEEFFSK